VRVIGGTCRGRPLRAPAGTRTRPTSDRVREAIFDILGSQLELDGLRVLDLFAGSGALGIEALSRGATGAVFVDRAPDAVATVRANLQALDLAGRGRVVRAEVLGWLERRAEPAGPMAGEAGFDLAFCDPPYDFEQWPALLGRLPAPLAVLESSRPVPLGPRWEVVREKRYGGTLVTVASQAPSGAATQPASTQPASTEPTSTGPAPTGPAPTGPTSTGASPTRKAPR